MIGCTFSGLVVVVVSLITEHGSRGRPIEIRGVWLADPGASYYQRDAVEKAFTIKKDGINWLNASQISAGTRQHIHDISTTKEVIRRARLSYVTEAIAPDQ